jgi:hypothetical protein
MKTSDNTPLEEINILDGMMVDVIHAIEELIQTGAMILKYKDSYTHNKL